ncbi:LPXTG cell wall anchor domain-containing protein [Jiangella asiatica]
MPDTGAGTTALALAGVALLAGGYALYRRAAL